MADKLARFRVLNLGGLNIYVNPLIRKDGEFTRLVNVDSFPYGAKQKRAGYATFLGTADGSAVKDLFSWTKDDGTTLYNYRNSGTQLFYSAQGTGAWTACGNGSVAGTAHVGHTVLGNTLVIGDGVGSTRHTTSGTSFTDTTLAPVASDFEEYQKRVYAMGTASDWFYSTTNDATNWNTTGTSDSSSFKVSGEGRLLKTFKLNDKLFATKTSEAMFRWDGYSLSDMATALGPASPYSFAKVEDFGFWLNPLGIFSSGGGKPQLISNAVQCQIYNDAGNGIAGGTIKVASAVVHRYNYYLSMGTVTDDFTNEQLADGILKYDYQKNEFSNYKFNNFPNAWHSYKDTNGNQQLIFGDSTGQCYTSGGTVTTDNGSTIEAIMEGFIHLGAPELDKEWNWLWAFFNPGNEAKIQVAIGDSLQQRSKRWVDIGDCSDGVTQFRFPKDSRGKFLFYKIYEASRNARFNFYGFAFDALIVDV